MIYFWLDLSADYPPDVPELEDVEEIDATDQDDDLPIGPYEYLGSIYTHGLLAD